MIVREILNRVECEQINRPNVNLAEVAQRRGVGSGGGAVANYRAFYGADKAGLLLPRQMMQMVSQIHTRTSFQSEHLMSACDWESLLAFEEKCRLLYC